MESQLIYPETYFETKLSVEAVFEFEKLHILSLRVVCYSYPSEIPVKSLLISS